MAHEPQEARAHAPNHPNSVIRRRSGWRAAFFIYNSVMEREIIRLFKARNNARRDSVRLGIGDDGAILSATEQDTVWVTDTISEGVHFDLAKCSLEQVGRKAMAVNLSDIAAMGAEPIAALVTIVLPRSLTIEKIESLASGICDMADVYDVAIVGGDTNRHDGPLVVGVAISGSVDSGKAWRLDGARENDLIVVTGKLGGSISGRHLNFLPRVNLARYIASNYAVHAATDISDSLTIDLGTVVSASRVSAKLLTQDVPITQAAKELSKFSGKSALEHALFDGEDFELLLTLKPDVAEMLVADKKAQQIADGELFIVGEITSGSGAILDHEGNEISPRGYEH